jgi:hypothetical protein
MMAFVCFCEYTEGFEGTCFGAKFCLETVLAKLSDIIMKFLYFVLSVSVFL